MSLKKEPVLLLYLQPTSPLRNTNDIDSAIEKILESDKYDSLFTYSKLPDSLNPRKFVYFNANGIFDSKKTDDNNQVIKDLNLDKLNYIRNGAAVYATKVKGNFKALLHGNIVGLEMPWIRSVDIDTFEDFQLAEALMGYFNSRSVQINPYQLPTENI
jgi:CMP-N,N'-diacetyllegionaminic acid synthase